MRIGINPEKENKKLIIENYHRIIVPVYIPHFEGYFNESFEIFKLCIRSLLKTIHKKTRITIYNNNCHPLVKAFIDEEFEKTIFIDQVFHSKENLGKINAILAAVKGNLEPLITITDSDVLFKQGWQEAVEDIFVNFSEAGMVSPVPSSKALSNFTSSTWFYGFFKGKLSFENVIDPDAMHRFDLSLGNETLMYKPIHLEKYLVLKNKNNSGKAVLGCGHFVATLKRDVFDKGTSEPAFIKIVGGVEAKFIDRPNNSLGYLRLATMENYAFHMGNKKEQWMDGIISDLKQEDSEGIDVNKIEDKKMGLIGRKLGLLIVRFVNNKNTRGFILKRLGLPDPLNY
ncbi:glycosyltransferase family A protein [Flavobacterium branchiicola]|uniref:Glycosyltransferase family A protein n=1 Tax=Flavobacterium branchiicola TaxID=1114875 RepID=A0ABV9PK86_9FLAO|nr:glycosyltransferase family A protein [Flavobacterium branchiicola]MBS7255482.1 glycosyltransferase family 2 protein [Flavobacterium branchiicola]